MKGGRPAGRFSLGAALAGLFGRGGSFSGEEAAERVEEVLLGSDLGPGITSSLLERARRERWFGDPGWRARLGEALASFIPPPSNDRPEVASGPLVTLLVGTNGSGKTTTVARLAALRSASGARVLMACADTFRAAAAEQITEWGSRLGIEVFTRSHGTDPGSVAYDSIRAAVSGGFDEVLMDTAGRLSTRQDLMAELGKVHRVCSKALPGAPHSTLLVMDASIGQSALPQARSFTEALPVTGLVLTKLDGTARGGSVIAVAGELGLPVEYVGTGEGPGDIEEFSVGRFIDALLDEGS